MNVLVADGESKVRSALELLLEGEPGIGQVVEASETQGLLRELGQNHPDLLLLDWELPGIEPSLLVHLVHFIEPGVKVVSLSVRPEIERCAMSAGADAFVCKADSPDRLLKTLHSIGWTPAPGISH